MHNQEDSKVHYFKIEGKLYSATWEDYVKIMNNPYPIITQKVIS